jgi:aspartate/tyrosine/aromatic aminotransferase
LLAWDPNANNFVFAFAISGDSVYMGGVFTSVSATVRNRAAAVNTSGSLLAWNPSASSTVFALAISGDNVYMGGVFTSASTIAQERIAAINTLGATLAVTYGAKAIAQTSTVYSLVNTPETILVHSPVPYRTYGIFISIKKSDNKVINFREQL